MTYKRSTAQGAPLTSTPYDRYTFKQTRVSWVAEWKMIKPCCTQDQGDCVTVLRLNIQSLWRCLDCGMPCMYTYDTISQRFESLIALPNHSIIQNVEQCFYLYLNMDAMVVKWLFWYSKKNQLLGCSNWYTSVSPFTGQVGSKERVWFEADSGLYVSFYSTIASTWTLATPRSAR